MKKTTYSAIGIFLLVASFNAKGDSGTWTFAVAEEGSQAFVSVNTAENLEGPQKVNFLRNYDSTINLGIDPVSGTEWYPHQSVKIAYEVQCHDSRLAMRSWKMFSDKDGAGEVIWADKDHGHPGFVLATSEEEIAVVGHACGETVALK